MDSSDQVVPKGTLNVHEIILLIAGLLPEPLNPLNWMILLHELQEIQEDQEMIAAELLGTLIKHLTKVIHIWKKNATNWEPKSIENLLERLNGLIGGTCQTSLSPLLPSTLTELVKNLYLAEKITREDYSFLQSMETTSTLSTTAVTAPDRADARGKKRPLLASTYDQDFVKQHK